MNTEQLAWIIRREGIEMTHLSHGSHIGSVLSVAEIVAILYNEIMTISADNPRDINRDRFILSKGHAGVAVYIALAYKGFFPMKILHTQGQDGTCLSEHISCIGVPGVEVSTGSLGHGIGIGCGMALAAKRDGRHNRVFVVMGDGECEEGSVWEAAMFANHMALDNLIVTIDSNKMQALTTCDETMSLSVSSLKEKWEAFGWNTQVVDGHDIESLRNAYNSISRGKPNCIIAETVKGKGVSFMENTILWHYRDPQGMDYKNAVIELERLKQ